MVAPARPVEHAKPAKSPLRISQISHLQLALTVASARTEPSGRPAIVGYAAQADVRLWRVSAAQADDVSLAYKSRQSAACQSLLSHGQREGDPHLSTQEDDAVSSQKDRCLSTLPGSCEGPDARRLRVISGSNNNPGESPLQGRSPKSATGAELMQLE